MRLRIAIGGIGVLLGLFGVFRLLTQVDASDLAYLLVWLVGALVIHDGVLSPIVVAVGVVLERVPPLARRFLQAGLVAGALVFAIAWPMIHRENSQPASKAILTRNYSTSLLILLAIITVVSVGGYAIARAGTHARSTTAKSRPPDDHTSTTE